MKKNTIIFLLLLLCIIVFAGSATCVHIQKFNDTVDDICELPCRVVVRPYLESHIVYDISQDWKVSVKTCAIRDRNIKSDDFIFHVYSQKNKRISKKYRNKINALLKKLYAMDENIDYGHTVDDSSDIKVLINNKSYWAAGEGMQSMFSHNIKEYDEVIGELAYYIQKAI
ncbi:MAG: hypothetical protein Q4G33_07400 [bacterium]|nr:hypothetical protein [bacterium]